MTLHRVEFEGLTPEWGEIEMDFDPTLNDEEKWDIAQDEIRDLYPDYVKLTLEKIEEI